MNSNSTSKKPQDTSAQDTLVLTSTANKTEMLQRIEQAYHVGNQLYERIGEVIDIVCDKRSAIEAFQATDEFSTSQVDQIVQALSKALERIHQDLDWLPESN